MTKEEKKEKIVWYKTWWGVLIVIFLILPFFLIWQVWAKTKWSKGAKIAVTAGIVLFYAIFFAAGDDSNSTTKTTDNKIVSTAEPTKTLSAEEEASAKKKAEEEKIKKDTEEKAKAEAAKELDAEIRFSSTAFQIKNKEAQDWTGCKFVLNGKVFGSDYTYKTTAGINANDSVIIPMNEFTKGDGTRFNQFSTKPKNLFLSCEVNNNHRTGYYAISE